MEDAECWASVEKLVDIAVDYGVEIEEDDSTGEGSFSREEPHFEPPAAQEVVFSWEAASFDVLAYPFVAVGEADEAERNSCVTVQHGVEPIHVGGGVEFSGF